MNFFSNAFAQNKDEKTIKNVRILNSSYIKQNNKLMTTKKKDISGNGSSLSLFQTKCFHKKNQQQQASEQLGKTGGEKFSVRSTFFQNYTH